MPDRSYPLFHADGSPRELGRAHGEQAADRIAAFLDNLSSTLRSGATGSLSARAESTLAGKPPVAPHSGKPPVAARESLRSRALRFRPLFAQHCPHLLEEINGLAEGAKIDPADALAVQLRGELAQLRNEDQLRDEACTTFVIGPRGTADGRVLIGQTSDTPPEFEDFGYVLHLVPDGRPELLMWTFGGMIGYHGVNRHGVAHFANALGGGPAWKFALSHYPLKRMMLEQKSVGDVMALMRRVPVCSNGNYVLCDGAGHIVDVELTSGGPEAIDDAGAGFIAHSNHFLCAPHACRENFEQGLADSFPRLERMRSLIREKFGSITVDDMKAFLSDHAGHPSSICRHPQTQTGMSVLRNEGCHARIAQQGGNVIVTPNDHHAVAEPRACHPAASPMLGPSGKTVAALIAEPARGVLHVAQGNPCENSFVEYSLR